MAFKKLFSRKAKPLPSMPINNNASNMNSCFDCNICLDFVSDPVVTLCGHLYCWPCIYEWFNVQTASRATDEHLQCPVCKAEVSPSTVVPLYGRGETPSHSAHNQRPKSPSVPPRPPAYGTRAALTAASQPGQQLPFQNRYQGGERQYYPPYEDGIRSSSFEQGRNPSLNVVHPVLEMFVDLIYARVFGNSSRDIYSLQNSYHHAMNPRLRRQEMQANKFLSRISLFFLCCIVMCLVLF